MYVLEKQITFFGIGKDIAPIVHEPKKNFCSIAVDQVGSMKKIALSVDDGEIFVNGSHLEQYETIG